MTPNEYQKEALRTASGMSQEYPRILNGLMGLNGEAGECIDILKKHLFQGHDLDREHMAKELGDVAWYLAVSADAIGYDLETIFQKAVTDESIRDTLLDLANYSIMTVLEIDDAQHEQEIAEQKTCDEGASDAD